MSPAVLSRLAQQDIDEIWDYSAKTWGPMQADEYVNAIRAAVEVIAADPRRGRASDEAGSGYRKYRVRSHMIFYRMSSRAVEVVRILHQGMDFERHLRGRT